MAGNQLMSLSHQTMSNSNMWHDLSLLPLPIEPVSTQQGSTPLFLPLRMPVLHAIETSSGIHHCSHVPPQLRMPLLTTGEPIGEYDNRTNFCEICQGCFTLDREGNSLCSIVVQVIFAIPACVCHVMEEVSK